ncbi:hypothetical protein BHE74_00014963 [Ensete ventricosum]|uniref:Uncharacterized protein n=1 Tax=Ensete ventricosum TaxID=4639 RepID=A0A444G533_ENSVE|nr:hypothetical protein B296_00013970 [Ensete ventricosum]RWW30000.1 hypothetical protein GW17_00005443 [Ensete ventricosum]RWW76915.1 hypothetical protein BHE74_00014963 [Ensete ventricosum]RZR91519.1 hypothetical protein BHM03_00019628 [Ensete ventricosum]
MIDLSESGEGSLEARWAMLTPKSKVWIDGSKAQLFYKGLLCPPLVKEIYTTPLEALLDSASKNLVMHYHFSMGLIDKVHDSRRVIDELSRIIDELHVEIQKPKEEADPVAMVIVEAWVNEMTQ